MIRTLFALGVPALFSATALADIERTDFSVMSEPGVEIGIREIVDGDQTRLGAPVVLLHGARVPGIASFDLSVEGGSLAEDLARNGLAVYIVDLRGYGASSRPAEMEEPPAVSAPLVRSGDAVRDLSAAVDAILERAGVAQVAILGWATGGPLGGILCCPESAKGRQARLLQHALWIHCGPSPDRPWVAPRDGAGTRSVRS